MNFNFFKSSLLTLGILNPTFSCPWGKFNIQIVKSFYNIIFEAKVLLIEWDKEREGVYEVERANAKRTDGDKDLLENEEDEIIGATVVHCFTHRAPPTK